jgi:O-antigen chain-terminating methyltransferase
MSPSDQTAELAERLRAIRESIRRGIASESAPAPPEPIGTVSLEDARAGARRAAQHAGRLGQLNPRPPGLANDAIQASKGAVARSLDWMLRPQRDFNQEVGRALDALATAQESAQQLTAAKLLDIETKSLHELREVRGQLDALGKVVAERLEHADAEMREAIRDLRWTYEGALSRHLASVEETRRRLNEEVRELNRRFAAQARAVSTRPPASSDGLLAQPTVPSVPAAQPASSEVDYFALEKDFRGTEQEILSRQSFYLPYFKGQENVLDVACGRGEFLELMRQAGVQASGVDLDADMVGRCLEKGLRVTQADVFQHLAEIADGSLGGVFSSQFVEHLPPADYSRLVLEATRKLAPGGVLAIETQNPECLAIFAKSFYIDPTHVKPIPAAQLRFLLEQAGLEDITTHYLSPASAQLPLIDKLAVPSADAETLRSFNKSVENFNAAFFGGMDYAVIGRKPGGK